MIVITEQPILSGCGSQTEPVFRIMADALGSDKNRHDYLLNWQRELVEKADELSSI